MSSHLNQAHCNDVFVGICRNMLQRRYQRVIIMLLVAFIGTSLLALFTNIGYTPFIAVCVVIILQNLEVITVALKTLPRDAHAITILIKVKRMIKQRMAENKPIPTIFDEQIVPLEPSRIALHDIESGDTYTFREMRDLSRRVANYFQVFRRFEGETIRFVQLQSLGYKRGDVIALFMTNSAEFPIVWLGLARLGVITAWVNFNQRNNVLGHSINISKANSIVVSPELQEAVAEAMTGGHIDSSLRTFVFGSKSSANTKLHSGIPDCTNIRPLVDAALDTIVKSDTTFKDILCYIYTSGTTGLPKAAVIKHYRFAWMAGGIGASFGCSDRDTLYITMPMYHSAAGILGVGQVILNGSAAVIRRKFSASRFWEDCIKYECTASQYIGEIARYLLAQPEKPTDRKHRVWLMFGNGLRPKFWREFCDRFNIKRVGEFYGSTEGNSNIVNTDNTEGAVGFFPVYTFLSHILPIALVKVDETTGEVVRDKNGLCVRASRGESGQAVGTIRKNDALVEFSGYANSKEATDKKIIRDVFTKGDFAFSSGDILYMDKYGYLFFKDRTGDTFRWKGENVSTTEVEAVVQKCLHNDRDATVYGVQVPGQEGKAGMVAIVDPDRSISEEDLNELSERMKSQLPPYARPLFVRLCKEVEKTGTHKLKKTQLVKDGIEVNNADDRLFYMDMKTQKYKPLDAAALQKIKDGDIKF